MSLSAADVDRYWTFADWPQLPDCGPGRYEIVDGNLQVTPPPAQVHQLAGHGLQAQLQDAAPSGWLCLVELAVPLADDHVRIADLAVVRWPLTEPRSDWRNPIGAFDIGLIVEVVSPRSRRTDRFVKPQEYAEAGIGVFWRLETEPAPALHTFTLVDGAYVAGPVITASGRAPTPWGPVEIRLTELMR